MPAEQSTTERPLSGDDIIAEVLGNAEASQFRMRRTVLIPSVFHVYLHSADFELIRPVLSALKAEIRAALSELVDKLNRQTQPSKVVKFFGFGDGETFEFRTLDPAYTIDLFPDQEEVLARGDIEVRSELASAERPEFDGALTRHVTRRQVSECASDSEATVPVARPALQNEAIFGWLRYSDEGKEQIFPITKDEIAIGRGGKTVWVDVRLNAPPDVSREHCRIRRDPASQRFYLKDLSQFGTSVNGRKLPSGIDLRDGVQRDTRVEVELPAKALITLADVVNLSFETAGVEQA